MIKKILLILLFALIVIQFFHPEKNKSEGVQSNYIGNTYPIPPEVSKILEKACDDCHSNNTRYPWYSKIQPVDWWLDNHIREGKKQLNFDEYTNRPLRVQYHKMEEAIEQIKEGEMPLSSYTWVHKDARLTDEEKDVLISWAEGVQESMKANYPMDSLIRKKSQ